MNNRHAHHHHTKPWHKRPLSITLAITLLVLLISLFIAALQPFLHTFFKFWSTIWWAILLGFIIAGMIDALVPNTYISSYLAQPGQRSIYYAAILGFIMSVCSHGILAIAMELHKKGGSIGAVITFLLASPWANLGIAFMLIAMFGLKALLFMLAAIVIAVITGLLYQILDRYNLIEKNPHTSTVPTEFSVKEDINKRWHDFTWSAANIKMLGLAICKGSWKSIQMVLWWVIIGTLIGSALDSFVPHQFFKEYLAANFTGLLITLAIATVIEVCSEGSAPIAFAIYEQTASFGNAFIFLMAGVITDFTEIGLIWINIGRKSAIWLPIITIPQAILVAYLFNHL